MNFKNIINKYAQIVNEKLDSFLLYKYKLSEELGDFPKEYYNALREYLARGGKRLRPVCMIMAYHGVGGKDDEKIFHASLSTELLHNATLIHDDIIDHDETRRGGATFHIGFKNWYLATISQEISEELVMEKASDFGISMGLLAGDLVHNLGLEVILTSGFEEKSIENLTKAINMYNHAFTEVINGVLIELDQVNRETSIDEYFEMIDLKTSALFDKSIGIGAILGNASQSQVEALKKYSLALGKAFQIQDDVLGTFGAEETTGKPSTGDIKEGKKTVLLIKALENASPIHEEILAQTIGNKNAGEEEVEKVRKVFIETGALEYAKKLAEKFASQAKEALDAAKPPLTKETVDFFKELADFVVKRMF